jgi:hypothetical protein
MKLFTIEQVGDYYRFRSLYNNCVGCKYPDPKRAQEEGDAHGKLILALHGRDKSRDYKKYPDSKPF